MRKWLIILLAVGAMCAASYYFRNPILTGIAEAYIIDEQLEQADAIVIPGGGIGWRPVRAASLFHAGYAPRILILDVQPDTAVEVGVRAPDHDLMRQVLIKKGVPDTNIIAVGKSVSSSYEDIVAVRDWAATSGAKRVIIATDLFHTRRMKWIAAQLLEKNGVSTLMHAVTKPEYAATNWWQSEHGIIEFQNEVVKFGFYLWKY